LVSQPDTGEQALEIAETLVRSGAIDVIVVDSVAALTPRAEIEGEMGDAHMGLQARLMSQALRKLTGAISKSLTTVIFINQIRMKLGVMFGNPETTTGGNALKFYSSVRLDIRRIESIKEGQDVVGSRVRVKVVKNKMAPPFKQAEFDILFSQGISKAGELVDLGVDKKVLEKSGAWYSYHGERLGQGRDAVRDFLLTNQPLAREIEGKLRDLAGVPGRGVEKPALAPAKDRSGGKAWWRCQLGVVGPVGRCTRTVTKLPICCVVEPFRKGGPQRVTAPYTKRTQTSNSAPK
jgi:recombination protein RecA